MNNANTYERVQRTDLNGRELEASILSRAARKLNRCAQAWDQRDTADFREMLDDALSFTQRIWTFLQVNINDPEHPLPPTLRVSLIRLSRYVDQTVMRLYSDGRLEDLRSLVRINQELAAGLLDRTGQPASPEVVGDDSASVPPVGIIA